jgi:hypothetical protein
MKKIIVTFSLLISSIFSFAQSFEGEIVYSNTFKSKMENVTDQQLTAMIGDVQNYYIKGGDYKSETNGNFFLWQLYINSENRLYNKVANSDVVTWFDGLANSDSVISTELHPNAVEVLGYKCDELVLNCKNGVQKYYFTSKLLVDGKLYANHRYGNWSVYVSKANALPLKFIIDNEHFILEGIATAVKPMKLDQTFFTLPVGVKTEKSPD